jgi:uncharacterized protein YfaS (alpha-2-macroglobulin family)
MSIFIGATRIAVLLIAGLALTTAPLVAQDLLPPKRVLISEGVDLPGGDLQSIFNTTLDACQRACLSNDRCEAFTFNNRNGSCFPKGPTGEASAYEGAVSGQVRTTDASVMEKASTRAGEIGFLGDWEFPQFLAQAEYIGTMHPVNGLTADEFRASAVEAENSGDVVSAARAMGGAVASGDLSEDWAEYARLSLAAGDLGEQDQSRFFEIAYQSAANAYLRADNRPFQHSILLTMGDALERQGRGRDKVQALRLAQKLQERDDTALALDDAIGKYGFRVVENIVENDRATPHVCVNFSEPLVASGVDYASFVQLDDPALAVSTDGYSQLCVEGLAFGTRAQFTLREGLPAADGQSLAKSTTIAAYIRDRNPGVRFAGRGYVLPKGEIAAIPVETVNTDKVKLELFRVTDRNLLRSLQNGYFGQPMAEYQEYDFESQIGRSIWTGSATVGQDVNRDVTTRLPMDEAIAGQPAGVYALRAAVPGVDPYVVPAAWAWFVVSDLGLTTLSGTDGLHVFVRSLGTAAAKPGATVDLISRSNEVLGSAVADDQGYARFDAGLALGLGSAAPAMIVVREGAGDLAFLSLTDPEFDLSDRGVEGREAAPPVDLFVATDRGAYRAGETVYVTALARDQKAEAITGLPLTAVLLRPDGVEYSRAAVTDSQGGYVLALPVAGNAPRGTWRLEMLADQDAAPLASKTFLVEDFLPERIDFTLALPGGEIRLGDSPELTVDAAYLFGAPGAGLAVEGDTLLRAASRIEGWEGYRFGPHDTPFQATMESFGGQVTDDDGTALIDLALPVVEDPGLPLEIRVRTRVAEGSGRPVEREVTKILAPASAMIGVKPMFDEVVTENSDARFAIAGVGPDLVATPLRLRWVLNRIQTQYQWYQNGGSWNWEPVVSRSREAEGELELATGKGEIATPVTWGEYELRLERVDGGGAALTSTTFYAGWYAPADTTATPDTLEMSLDKPAYLPGETAKLRVVPRAAGTALIAVMSNRLISMQAVAVTEGENLIDLPVTDEWGAGAYVTVSALRPMDVAAGRNPARALGLAHAAVDPGPRVLKAVVEVAAEADPRGPLPIAVKVDGLAAGDKAFVTIATVDQGILNLTGFSAPDPQGHFFGQRRLGMGIRDVYGRLIDGMSGATGEVRSGGDAGAQARLLTPPPTEKLVAFFTGPIEVGADGYARAQFDLPSFNGSVKVMAVAWSAKGVGQAEAQVLVRDPVVVTASLPRFMAPGDQSRVLLEIVHASGPTGRMGLDVSAKGVTLGDVPSGFDLAEKAKAEFEIPLTAGDEGIQTITVALTTPDGRVLTKDLSIPVMRNDPPVQRVTRLDLASGQEFTFDQNAFAGLLPGSSKATMAVGPIARINAPGILAALDAYPYGCTEQITSKAMPLLYFDQVAVALDLKGADNIRERVEQAVTEVLTNQSSNGAFGLWGPSSGDMWLDAYVTDFLSRARAQGFAVPDQAFRMALDNLRNQVNYQPDFDQGGEALAYALMVLAREGAAAIGDLRYYADVKGDAFSTPAARAQLGAALASYGDQPRADAMFRRAAEALTALPAGSDTEQLFRIDFGSHDRDAAAVLALAVEAGSNAVDAEALVARLAANDRGLSTQEATWALLAANALIDRTGQSDILIDGQPASGPIVKVLDSANTSPVVISNNGADTAITLTTIGIPVEPEPAGGQGYGITRSYFTPTGEPVDMSTIAKGDRLVVVIEVTPYGRGEARLMVNDPLPAGFEIDNPNLMASGSASGLDWLEAVTDVSRSEFRQDRFLTALDRYDNQTFRLAYQVRAISPGEFHHPAAVVEDMYRPYLNGRSETGRLSIAP